MNARMLLATALAVSGAGVAASTAAPATGIVSCKTVKAAGKTWHVQAAAVKCVTARAIVARVAVKKPDHVVHHAGGVIDQYVAPFSGLRCFKALTKKLGEIQCTGRNGKQTVLGIYK